LHYGIPAAVYHADPCPKPSLSASIAQILVTQSPIHAWYAHPRLNKKYVAREKEKFDLGTAAHAFVLEGADGAIQVIDAENYRKQDAQDQRDIARAAGKIPILAHQMVGLKRMVDTLFDAVERCPDLRGIFQNGKPEVTGIWKEGKNLMRDRYDWLTNDHGLILDYKTTENADVEAFTRGPLANLGYDLKAAFYLRGLKAITGRTEKTNFVWIVQETEEPYAVSFVGYSDHMAEIAERKVERAIKIWTDCVLKKSWPGYTNQIAWAELPSYAEQRFAMFEAIQDGLLAAGGM
jgi:hypothetical protein